MTLSIDHAASSYDNPVLVIDGQAYGPNDTIPDGTIAAHYVAVELTAGYFARDADQAAMAEKFIRAYRW